MTEIQIRNLRIAFKTILTVFEIVSTLEPLGPSEDLTKRMDLVKLGLDELFKDNPSETAINDLLQQMANIESIPKAPPFTKGSNTHVKCPDISPVPDFECGESMMLGSPYFGEIKEVIRTKSGSVTPLTNITKTQIDYMKNNPPLELPSRNLREECNKTLDNMIKMHSENYKKSTPENPNPSPSE